MAPANPSRIARHLIVAALAIGAGAAQAQRDLCPDRPGLNTPPCIVDRGRLMVEASAIDWTLDRAEGMRSDTVLTGDALLRLGVTDRLEARIGFGGFGHLRERDAAGGITRSHGIGDTSLSVRWSLLNPDGGATSVAIQPVLTVPTGGRTLGAGAWSAALLVPLSHALSDSVTLIATPQIDAAPDADRSGRHLAWGSAAGVEWAIANDVSLTAEAQLIRDDDPSGHVTQALGALSIAWQPGRDVQFDAGVVAGLNHASPDFQLIAGIARRF